MLNYMFFLPIDKALEVIKQLDDFKKEIAEIKLPENNGNSLCASTVNTDRQYKNFNLTAILKEQVCEPGS